ncbi:hypothetical protein GC175_04085 [bacterium]|nr:hypothetical protein [bacterium]
MGKTNFDDLELGDRSIEAREIGSESATDGQVLTADGTGGAAWEDVAGAVRMVGTALIGGDLTGDARGAYAVDLQSGRYDPAHVASGERAIAIGWNAKASGDAGVAIGGNRDGDSYWTKAEGAYSIAIGNWAEAMAAQVVAIGYSTRATAAGAISISTGYGRVYGINAVGIGRSSHAHGTESLALGYYSRAMAARAVAIGAEVQNATANSVKIGWNNTNGFAHFTTFTPSAVGGAATHELPVNLGGTVYRILLRA